MSILKSAFVIVMFACVILYTENRTFAGEMEKEVEINSTVTSERTISEQAIIARAAVLIDGETGRVLFGKQENMILPMASTTKIMTCILALENSFLDEVVEVSDYAASMPDVQLNIQAGERYRMEDLLYSLMLESHNDVAVAIAEHIGGSVELFAGMMNQKARDIGCSDSYFITPNGLDERDNDMKRIHSSTAKEMARILRYCLNQSPKREVFRSITKAPSHSFSDLEHTRTFSCVNHNSLLTTMEGAISGKTGFTGEAGYCYVGAVQKGERQFIAAVLGCGWPPHKSYKWLDIKRLIDYGVKAYDYYEIQDEPVLLEEVPVNRGIEKSVCLKVCYPKELRKMVLMREDEKVTIRKKIMRSVSAPVEAGSPAGQLEYYIGSDLIASYPIVTAKEVGLWDFDFCAKSLLKSFLF